MEREFITSSMAEQVLEHGHLLHKAAEDLYRGEGLTIPHGVDFSIPGGGGIYKMRYRRHDDWPFHIVSDALRNLRRTFSSRPPIYGDSLRVDHYPMHDEGPLYSARFGTNRYPNPDSPGDFEMAVHPIGDRNRTLDMARIGLTYEAICRGIMSLSPDGIFIDRRKELNDIENYEVSRSMQDAYSRIADHHHVGKEFIPGGYGFSFSLPEGMSAEVRYVTTVLVDSLDRERQKMPASVMALVVKGSNEASVPALELTSMGPNYKSVDGKIRQSGRRNPARRLSREEMFVMSRLMEVLGDNPSLSLKIPGVDSNKDDNNRYTVDRSLQEEVRLDPSLLVALRTMMR